MFAGENFCKLDEKGRFLPPPYIRDLLCPEGQTGEKGVVFLKRSEPTCLRAYTLTEWTGVLTKTRARLDEDQSRLFMHHVVSETSTSEIDKAGRILIPGKFRKHLNLADDQEIVFPCASVMVIIVLLKLACTCATPDVMFFFSRRRTRAFSLTMI